MKKVLSTILCLLMTFCVVSAVYADEVKFTDVKPDSWYYEDVMKAVEMDIINGKSTTRFAPDEYLTYAEAIKLAACMYQIYKEGEVLIVPGGDPWYEVYVNYCESVGIITKKYNYTEYATRAGYMEIFANALPEEALKEINNVPLGTIPDVPVYESYCDSIYKLYRAGILQGVDSSRRCEPSSNIKRCEVAAIITRMMDESERLKFNMPGYEDIILDDPDIEIKEYETIVVGPSEEPYNPETPEYTLDSTKTPVEIKTQPQSVEVLGYSSPGTLLVEATEGSGRYTYQWKYRKGRETYDVVDTFYVIGATTNKLTIYTNPNNEMTGASIYCCVTDANGTSINSKTASVFGPFTMKVEEFLFDEDRNMIVTGRLNDGLLKKGDKLSVERNGKVIAFITVVDLQMFDKSLDEARKGDNIGLVFELTDGVRPASGDTVMRYYDYQQLDLSDIVN